MKAANPFILIASLALVGSSVNAADEKLSDKPAANSATNDPSFQQPKTLAELLALPSEQLEKVDIARMNLLCAEGLRGSENLNVEDCLRTLDAWTDHVKRETKRNFHHFLERPKKFNSSIPYYQLGMMGTVLAEDLRIRYNPERERQLLEKPVNQQTIEDENVFFSSSADVFIHGLLTGKHYGTCASMPFLYAAVGRRLGYPVTIAARKVPSLSPLRRRQRRALEHGSDGKDPISHGAGEGCKFTVQVGGQCFHAGAVNYAMWGTMWNLCQDAGVPGKPSGLTKQFAAVTKCVRAK